MKPKQTAAIRAALGLTFALILGSTAGAATSAAAMPLPTPSMPAGEQLAPSWSAVPALPTASFPAAAPTSVGPSHPDNAARRRGRAIRARLLADAARSQAAANAAGGWVERMRMGRHRMVASTDISGAAHSITADSRLILIVTADAEWSAIGGDAVGRHALALLGRPEAQFERRSLADGEPPYEWPSLAESIIMMVRAQQRAPISLSTNKSGRTYRLQTRDLGDCQFHFDTQGILRSTRFVELGQNGHRQRGVGLISYGPVAIRLPTAAQVVDAGDFDRARVAADLRRELRRTILRGQTAAMPDAQPESPRRYLRRRAAEAVAYFNVVNPGFNARWWTQGKLAFVAATNPYTSETVTLVMRLRGKRIKVTNG